MKFKVGDKVRWKLNGIIGKIRRRCPSFSDSWDIGVQGYSSCYEGNLEKIGDSTMSKYEELKNRINAVTGWDKEADDILQEILEAGIKSTEYSGQTMWLEIPAHCAKNSELCIKAYSDKKIVSFPVTTQCEKLKAFKKALLWLLDHSDIKKDEKKDKIEALEDKLDECLAMYKDALRQIKEIK